MTFGRERFEYSTGMTPRLRVILIVICTLILCSCRTLRQGNEPGTISDSLLPSPALHAHSLPHGSGPSLAESRAIYQTGYFEAYATDQGGPASSAAPFPPGAADFASAVAPGTMGRPIGPLFVHAQGNVLPRGTPPGYVASAWTPPGIEGPWPQDEFLADGGDLPPFAGLGDGGVTGLNPEDTVARYQTGDGTNRVQAFNRVFIYSPRFASVRQVIGLQQDEQAEKVVAVHTPTIMARVEEIQPVEMRTQNYQAIAGVQRRGLAQLESGQHDGAVSQAIGPRGFSDGFKPFENLSVIRNGIMLADEMPMLAQRVQAAIAWSAGQAVQVTINGQAAAEESSVTRLHSVYRVTSRSGETKLRLIKVASTATALPGETVDFTLRFDNVGTQPITELVIADNLATRLEYVDGASQSSKAAEFTVQPNEAGSATLIWKITEPLAPGDGGVIRFQCRVR